MKHTSIPLRAVLASLTAILLTALGASAVTFTNDTQIRWYDTNYDGLEVIVTNCILTVDGPHSFASVQVLAGGQLTHSSAGAGYVYDFFAVTNEPQVLSATNVATLSNTWVVFASLVVQDATGQVTYTNGVDYLLDSAPGTLLLTTNSAIAEGSTNLVSYQYTTTVPGGLSLLVAGDVRVAQGGMINADGNGYMSSFGTGHGLGSGNPPVGSGAGHGGSGGQGGAAAGPAGGTTYGSIQQPTMLGSGGGGGTPGGPSAGAAGGGSIKLVVGGAMIVDGTVSADGANALNDRAGGGSGGSVWLSARSFSGAGSISANGGAGEPALGGGGGGGRVSLQYEMSPFPGTIMARGGSGYQRGGAGTIYTRLNSQSTGQLLVDNGGKTGATTSLTTSEPLNLTLQGGAILPLLAPQTIGNLLIGSNAWITLVNQTLTVTNNATIQAGGGITADGTGNAAGTGPGAGKGTSTPIGSIGGGGGYGGYGAAGGAPTGYSAFGGSCYGTLDLPATSGSGGGSYSSYCIGGPGGGVARLNVTGLLLLDGRISADGSPGVTTGGGGGSGGSVWLTVGTLAGGGTISANGGAGNGIGLGGGGGGGGGRIAIHYGGNLFFGTTTSRGGGGAAYAGAGTVYWRATNQSSNLLVADNGGQAGTNTTWTQTSPFDLIIKGGAVVSPPSSQTIGTLVVASNGWLSISSQNLTVTGNATVQAGGGIIADGTGNPAGYGPGAGKYGYGPNGTYLCGGGGYGGYGASGAAGTSPYYSSGGLAYGSVSVPIDMGSGGGSYYNGALGGSGGGAIELNVSGVLQVDGKVSACGGPALTAGGGGGSGGSIYLTVGILTGTGTISANGGLGSYQGGGGGGGRIAIVHGGYDFTGAVSAYGAGGYAVGGAGTISTLLRNQNVPQIVADNGGQSGTNTSLAGVVLNPIDLIVRGGAVVGLYSGSAWPNMRTLLVASNSWLAPSSPSYTANMSVSGNATIEAGGGIIADGAGYPSGNGYGTGAGKSYNSVNGYIGGGGGHGGYGASGLPASGYTSPSGGTTYGNLTAPTDLGSGGGGNSNTGGPAGGAGGGSVRLTVTGTLQNDGRISARGLPAAGPSAGGGAGGSINLTVGTLTGSGSISVNGGAGIGWGGGGGGGRIAVSYTSANVFSGLMSAYGGGGYATGGAGSVYLKPVSGQGYGAVVLDNGGQSGTNSGWPGGASLDVTVKNGAWLSMWSSAQTIGNLLIASNGWIYVNGGAGITGYTLSVSGNAVIQAGGGIIGDGGGYSPSNGPGPGTGYGSTSGAGSGGGFGGCGGACGPYNNNPGFPGGRANGPVTTGGPGSAGGSSGSYLIGGAGGGAISLNVTGLLQVDGRISSAGGAAGSANAGGGSGGGIALIVGTLAGSGVIAANGGAGNGSGGGGGGGRIAITYTVNAFSGGMSAYGGGGYAWGGAGTIYTKSRSGSGQVLADNGGRAGTNTSWYSSPYLDLTVTGGAIVVPPANQTFTSLLITSNGWMSVSNQAVGVMGNATIHAGGGILADAQGNGANAGPGAGKYYYSSSTGNLGGGGGYGGYGNAAGSNSVAFGGITYGLADGPTDMGSGGGSSSAINQPAGAGGGALRLSVSGTLLLNGRLSANGGAAIAQGSGGGSGGSVWVSAGTLAGAGSISANGGAGNGRGGGGGGGRICVSGMNAFEGALSACGGAGYAWGGAGTIYTRANNQARGQLLVDNGGHFGTNTPLAFLSPFDLTIRGGAVAHPAGSFLVVSNLSINTGGTFTCLPNLTNLDLEVLRNATIDAGGLLTADGKGYAAGTGPGHGLTLAYVGSGAGYGGSGGASSMSVGGLSYGLAQQPADRGSGGGLGWGGAIGGAEGGGAIRLTVGGALVVNGRLSACGNAGAQDDAGGGSGGSLWLTAAALAGTGTIAADGGAGQFYDGGGGGGGRIAIYTPLNVFAGALTAAGGAGWSDGQTGTIYYSARPAAPQVASFTPVGIYTAAVSTAEIVFSAPVNPYSVAAPNIALTAPGGVAVSPISATALSPCRFQLNFPSQIMLGDYALTVGPQVLDLSGQPMSQVYTGSFAIAWLAVQGTVTDTNGQPVPDVVVQCNRGGPAATTDTNGIYLVSVPPVGVVDVVPSKSGLVFVPGYRRYYDVSAIITNQNYLAVVTTVPTVTSHVETNSLILGWYGIQDVMYMAFSSTNLVDWFPYTWDYPGTNGPSHVVVPMDAGPLSFFRVLAVY